MLNYPYFKHHILYFCIPQNVGTEPLWTKATKSYPLGKPFAGKRGKWQIPWAKPAFISKYKMTYDDVTCTGSYNKPSNNDAASEDGLRAETCTANM
jgi:hypothetical protein